MLFHFESLVTLTRYDRPRNYTDASLLFKSVALLLENYYFHYLLLRIQFYRCLDNIHVDLNRNAAPD